MWHRHLRPIKYQRKDDNRGLRLLREGLEGSDEEEVLRTKDVNVKGRGKKVWGRGEFCGGEVESSHVH